ncbi:hypothetical protein [Nocardia sp. XZ_19_385]|uniref:hypothetical protein n=1 Tax=Nocardia sp. XZ_19_385 TaxID=2769488 RepID=UPI00188FD7F5|nr:hypothetical protein [Nocardia sp. XZ_19_385]
MGISHWRGGVFSLVLALAGFGVTLTSAHRASPLWQVWAALAVSLCAAAGLVAVYGWAVWRELSRGQRLRWRDTVIPTLLIGVGVVVVLAAGELLAPRPGSGWRGDVLVGLAFAGGGWAGAAMLGVRSVVLNRPVPDAGVSALEDAVVELMALRRRLQGLLSALGSLVALSTLALGAGVLMGKSQPRELVVVFGAAGSALVALFYAPGSWAIRAQGGRLVQAIFATGTPGDADEVVDRLEKRSKLEQLVGVDRTLFADLQAALPVLGPLIAGAAVFLPK